MNNIKQHATFLFLVPFLMVIMLSGCAIHTGEPIPHPCQPNQPFLFCPPYTDINLRQCVLNTDLLYISELTSLSCSQSNIIDLSELGSLVALSELNLSGNAELNHTEELSTLIQLHILNLAETGLTELVDLESLTQLTHLQIQHNSITSISSLAGLSQLQVLDASHNAISDVTLLSGLTQLRSLNLASNTITTGVASLTSLTQLTQLDLSDNFQIPCLDLDTLETTLGSVLIRPTTCIP
jgi:Leucine-rich repeat (LRR) protein